MKRKIFLRASVLLLILAVLLPSVFAATEIISDVALTLDEVMAEKTGAISLVSGAPVKISGTILKDVPAEAICSEVLAYFSDDSCYMLTPEGNKVNVISRIGTGYIVTNGIDSYTIAVKGDVDGDTYVTGKDVVRARKLVDANKYTELEKNAIDYNKDGTITTSDLDGISYYANTVVPELSLKDRDSINLGDDFYATIDSALTGFSVMAHLNENAFIYEKNAKDPQQIWHFVRNSEGTYRIENLAFKKSLDVAYAANKSGANVSLYANHNDDNQKWGIAVHNDGYILYPLCAEDRVLDVTNGKGENENNIQIYDLNYTTAQKFYINKVSYDPSADHFSQVDPITYDTTFYGRLVFGTTSLSVSYDQSDATNVCVKTNSNGAYQTWKFESTGYNQYKITNISNGKVLDIANGTMADSTNIRVYASNDSTAQRWYLYFKDGRIVIRSAKNTNFVVDVSNGADQNNGNVHLYTYNGSKAQFFAMAGFTTTMPAYRVTCPNNVNLYDTYTNLEEAKAFANSNVQYGYVVYSGSGELVYTPAPTLAASRILWYAKKTADYVRDNGYTYGDAKGNPYYNRAEKVVSCDRFVGFTLAEAGYLANQPATRGTTLFGTNNDLGAGSLENFCISHGFVKITNINDVQAGDIVFVGYSTNDMGLAAQYRHYPKHVFIAASGYAAGGGSTHRYDGGSNARLQSTQPSYEALSTSNNEFRFAYRATK